MVVNKGQAMQWGSGLGVVIVVGGADDIGGRNGPDSHDPSYQQWGMHEGGGSFGLEAGSRNRCWNWEGVAPALTTASQFTNCILIRSSITISDILVW